MSSPRVGAIDLTRAAVAAHPSVSPPSTPRSPRGSDAFERDKLEKNYLTRCIELTRTFTSAIPQAGYLYRKFESTNTPKPSFADTHAQYGAVMGNFSGLVIGYLFHWLFKDKYQKNDSYNPFYRNLKTLASLGAVIGTTLTFFLPLPAPAKKLISIILANVFSFTFGLMALPYWLYRQYVVKKDERETVGNWRTGTEGWSKYAKTALVFGMQLGLIIGGLIVFISGSGLTNLVPIMGIASGITGIACFAASIIFVPLINKYFSKALVSDDKDIFRNNYVRTGISLGLTAGAIIGFFIANHLLPGLAVTMSPEVFVGAIMTLGAAAAAIIGGVVFGAYGHKVNDAWHVDKDTDNSVDYASRTTSYLFSFLGAAIGFFLPIPGGMALGTALGGFFGWFVGFGIIYQARRIAPEVKVSLPWSQRMASGANVGSILGAFAGVLLSVLVGPFDIFAGAMLGSSIAAFALGTIAAFWEKRTWDMTKNMLFGTPIPPYTPDSDQPAPITQPPSPTSRSTLTTTSIQLRILNSNAMTAPAASNPQTVSSLTGESPDSRSSTPSTKSETTEVTVSSGASTPTNSTLLSAGNFEPAKHVDRNYYRGLFAESIVPESQKCLFKTSVSPAPRLFA